MTNNAVFRIARGLDEKINQLPYEDGYVYFATDTKKIYLDANEQRTPMGGNTGIYYGKADFTGEAGPTFIFKFEQIDGDNLPNVNDLILNSDGSFYKVTQILNEDGEIFTEKLTIAGSGGGGNNPDEPRGEMKVEIEFDSTVIVGEKVLLKIKLSATDPEGQNTGDGRYEIKLNNIVKKSGTLINYAEADEVTENLIDITDLCVLPGDYTIRVNCYADTGGLEPEFFPKNIKINVVDFTTTWNYTDTTINSVYSDFTMTWSTNVQDDSYRAYVVIDDIYPFDIKGNSLHIAKENLADYGLKHGAHKIELQSFAKFGNSLTEKASNKIIKNVIFYDNDPNVTNFIVACDFFETNIQQYNTIQLPVMIYHANNVNGTATITFKTNNKVTELTNCKNLTKYIFTYTPDKAGFVPLQFLCGGTILDLNLNVEALDIDIQEVPGYEFKFKATDFANNEEVKQWTCKNKLIEFSENFDWINGGLKNGDNDVGPYFRVQAGHWMKIPYKLFAEDLKNTGACFKMVFKAYNCRDYDATVVNCLSNNKGLEMRAQGANIILNQKKSLNTRYCEDTYIEYEFDVCKFNESNKSDQYYTIWLDGIPANVDSMGITDSFLQANAQELIIGSEDCDVFIYLIKFYKKHLTFNEHLQNFIIDVPNASEILARYVRNDIVLKDSYGNEYISPELLAEKNPDCNVYLLEVPYIPTSKDDVSIPNPSDPKNPIKECCTFSHLKGSKNYLRTYEGVKVRAQGTSSMDYGIAAYNMDLKFPEKWSMDEEAIPVNYMNMKVNVASCEGANNALNQEWYNRYQPYRTQKRLATRSDGKVARDTMEFKNGVVFIKDNNTSTNSSPTNNNAFVEIEGYVNTPYHRMYSICNLGNSKKNVEVFHGAGNKYECCVEVNDNNTSGQRMVSLNGFYPANKDLGVEEHELELNLDEDKIFDENGFVRPGVDWGKTYDALLEGNENFTEEQRWIDNKTLWKNAIVGEGIYGFRYCVDKDDFIPSEEFPTYEDYEQEISNRFLRLVRWFVKNNPSQATNEPLEAPVTFPAYIVKGIKNTAYANYTATEILAGTEVNEGYTFTVDSSAYRVAKMLRESENYLILDSIFYHYIFIERHSMLDNVAKNTFWNTEDGIHWDLTKNYDNDTADGINNSGHLALDYGVEVMDNTADGKEIFNARPSSWLHFAHGSLTLREKMYSSLFDAKDDTNAWSANKYLELFESWQNAIPEICWIQDFYRKYFRPNDIYGDDSYLARLASGKKTHQRKQYELYQEQYLDSEYKASAERGEAISWRSVQPSNPEIMVNGEYVLGATVKMYADGYFSMALAKGAGTNASINIHIRGKKGELINFSKSQKTNFNDATCYIYSPNLYQEFIHAESIYPAYVTATNATKLRKFSFEPTLDSQKTMLKTSLSFGDNLEELILKDCLSVYDENNHSWSGIDLNLKNCVRLKKIDTTNSTLFASYEIADGAPLEEFNIYQPTGLYLQNLRYLNKDKFNIEKYNLLTSIQINNIDYNNINSIDILNNVYKHNNSIIYNLENVKWKFDNEDNITDTNIPLLDYLLTQSLAIAGKTKGLSLTGSAIIPHDAYSGSNVLGLYEKYGLDSGEQDNTYPNLVLNFIDSNENSKLYTINIENGDGQIVWTRQVEDFNALTNDILSNSAFGAFDATAAIAKSYSNEFIYNFANSWEYVVGDQISSIEPALEQGDYQYLDISKLQSINETNITIRPVYVTETRYYNIQICNEWGEKIHEAKVEYLATFEEVRPLVLPLIDDSNLKLDQTYYLKGYGTVRTDNSIIDEQEWRAVSDLTLYTKFEQKSVYEIDYSYYLNIDETGMVLNGLKKNENNEYIYQGQKIVIPKTIKTIASQAFGTDRDGAQKTNLKKVFFETGSSLTNIQSYAFGYSNLEYFEFVNSIQAIGQSAFRNCNLQAKYYNGILKLPTSLNQIGQHSFNGSFGSGSRLSQNEELIVKIPSNVTEIDSYGLAHWGTIKAAIDIGSSTNFSNLSLEKTQGSNAIISTNGDGTYDIYSVNFYTKKYNPDSVINGKPISAFFSASNPNYNITVNYINE